MFRFIAAAALAALLLAPAPPAEALPFDKEAADRVIEARSIAAFRKIGTGDLYRFNMLQKDLIAGVATAQTLEEGLELGRRWLDKEPVFAGSIFGAIVQAGRAGTLPAAPHADALYWNAIAYDRICKNDGELCQMLAVSILAGHPGTAALKASALRFMAYAEAAQAALPPDRAGDAARTCLAARTVFADRAAREARDTTPFYAARLGTACGTERTAAAPF